MTIEELPQFVKVAERKYKGLKITVKKYTSQTVDASLEGEIDGRLIYKRILMSSHLKTLHSPPHLVRRINRELGDTLPGQLIPGIIEAFRECYKELDLSSN